MTFPRHDLPAPRPAALRLLGMIDAEVWTGVRIGLLVAAICAAWPGGLVTWRRYYVRGRWWEG